MTTDATPADDGTRYPTTGLDATVYDRYAAVEAAEDLIIFDRECEDAWIQSGCWFAIEEYR